MKKTAAVLCAALLFALPLTSCSASSEETAEESRVELSKNKKITEYTVEDFSSPNYDIDELESYVKEEIEEYKAANKGRIRVKKDRVRKGYVYLTMSYSMPEAYAIFNGVECFAGTIEEALEEDYDFSMDFIMAEEEQDEDAESDANVDTITGKLNVPASTVIEDESLKIFIIGTDEDVTVPGNVQYYYSSLGEADLKSRDTVSVSVDTDGFGDSNLVYVIYS